MKINVTLDDELDISNSVVSISHSGHDGKGHIVSGERQTLARKETKAVGVLRGVVLLVLVMAAGLSSYAAYQYVIRDERGDFERSFASNAKKVIESFSNAVERKLGAMDMMSVQFTSYALSNKLQFPFVTLPHYEVRGANARIVSEGFRMDWLPLVTKENRKDWEAYTEKHRNWYHEADARDTAFRERQDEMFGISKEEEEENDRMLSETSSSPPQNQTKYTVWSNTFNPVLFTAQNKIEEGPGPYMPFWQVTPVVPSRVSFINFNFMSVPYAALMMRAAIESKQAVLDVARPLEDPSELDNPNHPLFVNKSEVFIEEVRNRSKVFMADLMVGQYRHTLDEFYGDPASNLAYPVFNNFEENRTVVGLLRTSLFWRLHFTDILPEGNDGVICVLENTKNQSFTYRLDGPNVTFIGPGDLHDPKYDHLGVSQDVASYVKSMASPQTWSYTEIDLNTDYNSYSIRVYPSQDMEDDFVTNKSVVYAVSVAAIFLFTSAVFIIYDCLVEHRQGVVMDRAVASGAIVSSLFPESVRERLMEENNDKKKSTGTSTKPWQLPSNGSGEKMKDAVQAIKDGDQIVDSSSDPIADLFPDTTIMFADIAGFTQWSAGKEPVEVFKLLETLYAAFDKFASRRQVFKVETIGDCYVAVTGLPTPQPDHAIVLAKFARDCMFKMDEITMDLMDTLGEDTKNLRLRVGLHSGPVTAGVLRGQKARFQLFGDTMNTASRMESNGKPGKIHISEETARELDSLGKSSWVVAREEKIVAKGKGELQTYWLRVEHMNTNKSAGRSSNTGFSEASLRRGDDSEHFGV